MKNLKRERVRRLKEKGDNMATVIEHTQEHTMVSTSNVMSQMILFIQDNWIMIVISLVMLILGIVIVMLIAKLEEERKERDDAVYAGYKNICRDCRRQADDKKIRKTWSAINLFWFGLPFVKNEHSSRIVDYRGDLLGWYRGHAKSQDGTYNILAYRRKIFIFFEDEFVIKMPISIPIDIPILDKITKQPKYDTKTGEIIKKRKVLNFSNWVDHLKNGDIKIHCEGLEKSGYYQLPVLIDKNKDVVDLRIELGERIIDHTYNTMLQRILSDGSRNVEKAMAHNPYLIYEQKSPEKTKEEGKDE